MRLAVELRQLDVSSRESLQFRLSVSRSVRAFVVDPPVGRLSMSNQTPSRWRRARPPQRRRLPAGPGGQTAAAQTPAAPRRQQPAARPRRPSRCRRELPEVLARVNGQDGQEGRLRPADQEHGARPAARSRPSAATRSARRARSAGHLHRAEAGSEARKSRSPTPRSTRSSSRCRSSSRTRRRSRRRSPSAT